MAQLMGFSSGFVLNKSLDVWCNYSFAPLLAKSINKVFPLAINAYKPFVRVAEQTLKLVSISIEGSETLVFYDDEGHKMTTSISNGIYPSNTMCIRSLFIHKEWKKLGSCNFLQPRRLTSSGLRPLPRSLRNITKYLVLCQLDSNIMGFPPKYLWTSNLLY